MYVLERVRKVVLAYQHTVETKFPGESGLLDELGDMGLRWQVRRIFVAEFDAESWAPPQTFAKLRRIVTFGYIDSSMS